MPITMDETVHIRSSWKDAIGPLLTNRRIAEHERKGWYGPQIAEKARAKVKSHSSYVFRCKCGESKDVRFLHYSYLPQAGWYCPRCLATAKRERDQEQELRQRVKDAARREYE